MEYLLYIFFNYSYLVVNYWRIVVVNYSNFLCVKMLKIEVVYN